MNVVKRVPAVAFIENLMCECGQEMKFTGESYLTAPPRYEHLCACGESALAFSIYPRTTHEPAIIEDKENKQ